MSVYGPDQSQEEKQFIELYPHVKHIKDVFNEDDFEFVKRTTLIPNRKGEPKEKTEEWRLLRKRTKYNWYVTHLKRGSKRVHIPVEQEDKIEWHCLKFNKDGRRDARQQRPSNLGSNVYIDRDYSVYYHKSKSTELAPFEDRKARKRGDKVKRVDEWLEHTGTEMLFNALEQLAEKDPKAFLTQGLKLMEFVTPKRRAVDSHSETTETKRELKISITGGAEDLREKLTGETEYIQINEGED
jgi:hypothetical protein